MKSNLDLSLLLGVAESLPFVREGTYIEMAARQSTKLFMNTPLSLAVAEIASLRKLDPVYVMINRLLPNSKTPWHQDWLDPTPLQPHKGPLIERWHLPLLTNKGCELHYKLEHGLETVIMPRGEWCGPVAYWRHHRVINTGDFVRIHLIVDLDCPEPLGEYEA